jgi:3-hydroxyisobutyrate dehydrogenase-like beta-hydroxyacid dehydrogenase
MGRSALVPNGSAEGLSITSPALRIAILGLGEAGSAISRDLVAAGALARGYDPVADSPPGVLRCASEAEAVRGAAVVLSLNSADDAGTALRNGAGALAPGAIWADLNTSAAGLKSRLADQLAALAPQAEFADVALMAPVPPDGLRTPMLACGPGAGRFTELLTGLGAKVELLPGPPGAAATRKLLRSVFFKGLAASVIEALTAARAAGVEDWLRGNIVAELVRCDAGTVERLESGSLRHARRRSHEMAAATELLDELGVSAQIAPASRDLLAGLIAPA